MKNLYIASPLGFSELGRLGYKELLSIIKDAGYTYFDPWSVADQKEIASILSMELSPAKQRAWAKLNKVIGASNVHGIEHCDGIVAVLDGTDVDSGTSSEIGYGAAKGKPILGYRGDFRLACDNEGGIVNLQVEYFITKIVTTLDDLRKALPEVFGM